MASSSSAIDSCDYHDVFLSFFGKDTRHNFTSHLHNILRRKNIKVFIDNEIKRGEKITSALEGKIEEAKISIIVFSKNYAKSTFCLDELEKIMECKESKGQIILPIFYKVEPSEATYEKAFDEHKANVGGKKRKREEIIEEELKKVEKWKSAFREAIEVAGWHIKEESDEADIIEKITDQVLTNLVESNVQSKAEELMFTSIIGQTAKDIFTKIWECLMMDRILRVGIYGMGGVGKTTIATRVFDELRRANSFTYVFWVTVSEDLKIRKLQNEIAKTIALDLSNEADKLKRAAKLRQRLKSEKFVLILDDVWEAFEIEEVGIPPLVGAQKLLLTSRNIQVCKGMKCKPIKVEPLSKKEALDLFTKESENKVKDCLERTKIMHSIVKECAGLPLAIIVVARRMRGVVEIREWRNTLRELQKPCEGENQVVEKKVFRSLKFSYDRLSNDKCRQCFLYCSLFPEDYVYERDDLITYLIGEGIINELNSRQAELDKGHCMIDELINASLFERRHGLDFITMHDVVRDMARFVIRENSKAQNGLQVQGLSEETQRRVSLKTVLFVEDSILKQGSANLVPNCSKLTTLSFNFRSKAYNIMELPSCFFTNIQNLLVLNMSFTDLHFLPDSIFYLRNLRVLLLRSCFSLEYIPSLDGLKNLWHLDLSDTNLEEIPKDMEELINLKVLRLSWYGYSNAIFSCAFLEKFSRLQVLELERVNVADALISLKKLETLRIAFYNFESLNLYFKSGLWKRLNEYHIVYLPLPKKRQEAIERQKHNHEKVLYIDKIKHFGVGNGETNLVLPDNIQHLFVGEWDNSMVNVVMNSTFDNLRQLEIKRCGGRQYVFTPALVQGVLLNVEILHIYGGSIVEEIISAEEELVGEINSNNTTIQLPKLKRLNLLELKNLRSIYKGRMVCPSLERIEICNCEKLKRLPFCMEEKRNEYNRIKLDVTNEQWGLSIKEWWYSLQWDDPNAKSMYQLEFEGIRIPLTTVGFL